MEFDASNFMETFKDNPSKETLEKLRKDDLVKLGSQLKITIKPSRRKSEVLTELIEHFVKDGLLEATSIPSPTSKEHKSVTVEVRKMELEFEKMLQERKLIAELELQERKLQAEKELQELKLQAEREWHEKKLQAEKEIELERIKMSQDEALQKNRKALQATCAQTQVCRIRGRHLHQCRF